MEPFVAAVLEDAPDLFVRFDGAAVDASGHERTLSPYGTAGTYGADPALGTVLDNTGRGAAWLASGYHLPADAFTLEAVVRIPASGAGGTILSEWGGGQGLILRTWEGRWNVWQSGQSQLVGSVTPGWHHVVYRWNDTARLWIDGVGHTLAYPAAPVTAGLPGVQVLTLNNDANQANRWGGLVYAVAVYPTPLSQARIVAHWEALGLS